ncbi:hypothetical protein ACWD5V_02525 [Streptomyces sp. NPDC002523]
MFSKRAIVAAVTAVLIAGLSACSGDSGGDGTAPVGNGGKAAGSNAHDNPSPDAVFGLRDTLRHVPARTTRATRPHLVKKCTIESRRVKHTSRSGSGKKRRTRTWYTTEQVRSCRKVRKGTETYTRVLRRERWCVRLDDVGGHASRDDVWYQVTYPAYNKALGADDHARLKFTPKAPGC